MFESIAVPTTASGGRAVDIATELAATFGGRAQGYVTRPSQATPERLERLRSLLSSDASTEASESGVAEDGFVDLGIDARRLDGAPFSALKAALHEAAHDLVVIDAVSPGEDADGGVGPLCERLVRRGRDQRIGAGGGNVER